jgi:DNA-binding transcriptional LysR family regulator
MGNIDLNLLRVFIAVYQHRSITLAAEELDLTQPGVSGLLKRLQQQVGTQLFVRSGRGIAPTHQAHELIQKIEPALINIDNAVEAIDTFSIEQPRKFIIYVSEPVMYHLIPKIESDQELGNISIEVQPLDLSEETLIYNLNQQKADLAIDFANYANPSFFSEFLYTDELCIIANKNHPRLTNSIDLNEFYNENHILLKMRREDAFLADYFTQESILERKVAAVCDSLLSQMALVSNSASIAVVATSLAEQFSEKLDLKILQSPFTSLPIQYRVLAHNRVKQSPSNMWLRNKLRSYFD